jgi:NAD(P)-dependent dehydrogenase (short-subunit alcohol dehydrogenase family)
MSEMLKSKAIVITGAGRGVGEAYASAAARHGAAVVVNDIDEVEAAAVVASIERNGGRAIAHVADVSSWDEAAGLIERCVAEFGRIDGLVNNAGIIKAGRPEDLTADHYRSMMEVNVLGTCYCGTHAIRQMLVQRSGVIVNVTSGAQAGTSLLAAYGATKGAVASLTYSWAIDLAESGIRVNAISPMAATRMYNSSLRSDAPVSDEVPTPESNAGVMTFLLSDASAAIHGQIVRIDGGRLSLMNHPAILEPVLVREQWTAEDVATAFARELGNRPVTLGLATVSQGAGS